MKTVIFTDLDGTLLHPDTYCFEEALPALKLIRKMDLPLVFCSSKTRAELEFLRKRLNNDDPFISENGGGIYVPKEYPLLFEPDHNDGQYRIMVLGMPYETIRKEFVELRERLGTSVKGFGDMTDEEVSTVTGLSRYEAALARARDFSEPFLFERDADNIFLKAVEDDGFHWTFGRLFCLMGRHDKGKSVRILKKLYEHEHDTIITIGIGDGLNDLTLFREVDHPVLVQDRNGRYNPGINLPGLILAPGIGPDGWNKAVLSLLTRLTR